jgi:hypothetical protein
MMLANFFSYPRKYACDVCDSDRWAGEAMTWLICGFGAKIIRILCFIDVVKPGDSIFFPNPDKIYISSRNY